MPICPSCNRDYLFTVQYCPDCQLPLLPVYEKLSGEELFKLAYNYHYEQYEFNAAFNLYQQLIKLHPDSVQAQQAQTLLAEIQQLSPEQKTAYEKIKNEKPLINLTPPPTPMLAWVFYLFGSLTLLVGLGGAAVLWPGVSPVANEVLKLGAPFVPSILLLMTGVIGGCLFFALGQIIKTLRSIEYATYRAAAQQVQCSKPVKKSQVLAG